ncbi:MAG: hypothetical protein R2849_23025 [Thermomicrobiales bacterium]
MSGEIQPVPIGSPSFINAPRIERLDQPRGGHRDHRGAVWCSVRSRGRQAALGRVHPDSQGRVGPFRRYLTHYDVDFGGEIFAGRDVRVVDCGDVAMEAGAYDSKLRATTGVD